MLLSYKKELALLDTERTISMDGQEIPILWKYIFNLETRVDKLEKILVTDISQEQSKDKAESDSKELTETELAKVLDNLVPLHPTKQRNSLLDKAWEKSRQVKDVTPIKGEKPKGKVNESSKSQQEFVDRLQNARIELEKNVQETVAVDMKEDTNYHRGYIIPVYDTRKGIIISPEKVPSDEYFLSKEYQKLRQAKLSLQPKCEFSGQTAQHVMHRHYNNLGTETPEDMWSLCAWHYQEVIGKKPKGEPPFTTNWILISPSNYMFQVEVLSTFAEANDLHKSSLSDVARGRNRHHKGWKCYRHKDYQRVLDYLNKTNKKVSDGTSADKSYPSIREINEGEKKSNEF